MTTDGGGSGPTGDRAHDDRTAQGYMFLARFGKRVIRPGGFDLTLAMLDHVPITGADVVELAPGRGRTAAEIVRRRPGSYMGVDRDPGAVESVREVVRGVGEVRVGTAADTGLADACADVVIGEAMLTMQSEEMKRAIVTEAVRLLRPGGRYAVYEIGLFPDTLADDVAADIRRSMARTLGVNAQPLTLGRWRALLTAAGMEVEWVRTAAMDLLRPGRLVADEGLLGALRFAARVMADREARHRIREMRRLFHRFDANLVAVSFVARRPA